MEQVSFQQQQFQGIVPVLDVGDASASLASAQSQLVSDQQDRLGQLQRDATVQQQNAEQFAKELNELGDLSKKAAATYVNYKNQQTKKEAAAVWAENIANFEAPEIQAAGAAYKEQEKAQANLETKVNTTVSGNVQKIKEPTADDSARAGRVRESTGLMSTVAANARAYAAMDSYGPAFQNFLTKTNQQRVSNGLQPIKPGSAEWGGLRDDFNKKWADKTGMSIANPGFTAAYVYPKLRQEMGRRTEQYTKVWNVGHADRQTEKDLFALLNDGMTLDQFWKSQRGLTRGDGVSLKTNDDVWRTLGNAKLMPGQLASMADGKNPSTGQSIKDHPRFNALITEARQRENQAYTARRTEQKIDAQQAFEGLETIDQIQNKTEELIQLGIPRDIVMQASTAARNASDRRMQVIEEADQVKRDIDALPEGGKLPPGYFDDKLYETKTQFGAYMTPSDQSDSVQEQLRNTDTFKSIEKDLKGAVMSLGDVNIKFGAITGGKDPTNWNLYKQDALNNIVARAQNKMFNEDMTEEQALREGFSEWRDSQKALVEKGELFDSNKNEFKPSGLVSNQNANEQARLTIEQLNNTELNNLSEGLAESDWTQLPPNGKYSERVKFLGRRFGMTPEEIINETRRQKGLQPLAPSPNQKMLQMIPPAERARISSLDDEAPISLAIRAQIDSGQVLSGSASQRTVAVGQQILHMGYGGIWQHPDFNYDSGFTGTGNEEVGTHAPNSYHKYGEALDIGVQANGHYKLEQLYQYLLKNRARFGVAELFYDPDGSRGHPGDHSSHIHVSFGGGDSGTMQ